MYSILRNEDYLVLSDRLISEARATRKPSNTTVLSYE